MDKFKDLFDKFKKPKSEESTNAPKKGAPGRGPKSVPLQKHPPQSARQSTWELLNKAMTLRNAGRLKEALEYLDEILELEPSLSHALFHKACIFHELKRYEEALRVYTTYLGVESDDIKALCNKGDCLIHLDNFEEANACFDQALKIDSHNALVHNGKGIIQAKSGKYQEAIKHFDKALAFDPKFDDAMVKKGACFESMDNITEAIRCYDKALAMNPQNPEAFNHKGNCLNLLGFYQEAIPYFNKALDIEKLALPYYNKAKSLENLNNIHEALDCYNKALELEPEWAEAFYDKALLEIKLGWKRTVAQSFTRFLEIAPAEMSLQIQHAHSWLEEYTNLSEQGKEPQPTKEAEKNAPARDIIHLARNISEKENLLKQKFRIHKVLHEDTFSITHLVYSEEHKTVYALRTFKDAYLQDKETIEAFTRHAIKLVQLGSHPFIVETHFIEEINRKPYLAMEHIAPGEFGLNSLQDYLENQPPDFMQTVQWAIQFCLGMEHMYAMGIDNHGNITPLNILISQDKIVKICNSGLAKVLSKSNRLPKIKLDFEAGKIGFSVQTKKGICLGTPTHMSPEHFTDITKCDIRSDIYSFGVVLYQLASGGILPFLAQFPVDDTEQEIERFYHAMLILHSRSLPTKLFSSLFPIIIHCLEKEPDKRYKTFKELRHQLEALYTEQAGESYNPLEISSLESSQWINKGAGLAEVENFQEALLCFDKALESDHRYVPALKYKAQCLFKMHQFDQAIDYYSKVIEIDPQDSVLWNDKGYCFHSMHRYEEALLCFSKAMDLDPHYFVALINKGASLEAMGLFFDAIMCYDKLLETFPHDTKLWSKKAGCYRKLNNYQKAINCYNKTLELDPAHFESWNDRGICYYHLGNYQESVRCFDKALEINPAYSKACYNKGLSLSGMGYVAEALSWLDKALLIDPLYADALYNKGVILHDTGRYDEAISFFDKALKINPEHIDGWYSIAGCYYSLGHFEKALSCYDKALALDENSGKTWYSKGYVLDKLSRLEEASYCFSKALGIEPNNIWIWYKQALTEEKLSRLGDALISFKRFLALNPPENDPETHYAKTRIKELE